MPPPSAKPNPTWVIDLHGMRDALRTRRNSVRVAVIGAIEAGSMHILKSVSKELKDLYPELYEAFQEIKNKKYVPISVAASEAAAMLMETCGTSPLGTIPPVDRFEAIATAKRMKAKLVSAGKAYTDCLDIARKNGFSEAFVVKVDQFD